LGGSDVIQVIGKTTKGEKEVREGKIPCAILTGKLVPESGTRGKGEENNQRTVKAGSEKLHGAHTRLKKR